MALTFEDRLFWAKKGAEFNQKTPDDDAAFGSLLRQSKMGKDTFVCYANAFEAAGESGVRALTHKKPMPEDVKEKALDQVSRFFEERARNIPPQHKDKIGFLVKAQGNTITVSEKRPLFNNPLKTSCSEIFQARYTDFDDRWHLYWMRASGKWWPYTPSKPIQTIEDCIREVKEDPLHCFWG